MTRQWINGIYNRTYADVMEAQSNPENWNSRGCWNATDLNRIENNTAYCIEWMLYKKIILSAPSITIREDNYWTMGKIPTKDEIDRIINNVRVLIDLSKINPDIAEELPTLYAATQINYILANEIEYALELIHDQLEIPDNIWHIAIENGVITTIERLDETTELINKNEAWAAEDEIITIRGVEYGENAQYQTFTYWSGEPEDLGLLTDDEAQVTTFIMPYRDVEFTANFRTEVPRKLKIIDGYISLNEDPTTTNGPTERIYYPGDSVMIIARIAPYGKAFYDWLGPEEALENITGVTDNEHPSVIWLVMPDCDVELTANYIEVGEHSVTVNQGNGSGWYSTGEEVTIYADTPEGYSFSHWSGNTSYLSDITMSYQTFTMKDKNISFTAHFVRAAIYRNVQMVDGLILVDGEEFEEVDGVLQYRTYTLIPNPPGENYGLDYWSLSGNRNYPRKFIHSRKW